MKDDLPKGHEIAKQQSGKISKREQAKLDRQAKEKAESTELSAFLQSAGNELSSKDSELISGLKGVAKRQGSDLMFRLSEAIPAAYAEGISESAKEATGNMSDNFRNSTEDFNRKLSEVFGIT